MNNILIDTGFWYALYDQRDPYYNKANEIAEYLMLGQIIIPFPTLYETVNSRFSHNKKGMSEFKILLERDNFNIIDDLDYKLTSLEFSFNSTLILNRPLSLVDTVIREMLSDESLKIDYLITFNIKDFIDVCSRRNITILSE